MATKNVQLKDGSNNKLYPAIINDCLTVLPAKVARIINASTLKWGNDTASNCYFGNYTAYPIKGCTISISIPAGGYIAFLKAAPTSGNVVSFCDGTTLQRAQNVYVCKVPEDYRYFYIYTTGTAEMRIIDNFVYDNMVGAFNQTLTDSQKSMIFDNLGLTNSYTMPAKSSRIIDNSDKWKNYTSAYCYFTGFSGYRGKSIVVDCTAGYTLAFLKSAPTLNNTVSYCDGTSKQTYYERDVFVVPSDCGYLYLFTGGTATIHYYEPSLAVADVIQKGNTLPVTSYGAFKNADGYIYQPNIGYVIKTSDDTWTTDQNDACKLVDVTDLRGRFVEVAFYYPGRIAFLNADVEENVEVSYCDTAYKNQMILRGEKVLVKIPQDAVYLYVFCGGTTTIRVNVDESIESLKDNTIPNKKHLIYNEEFKDESWRDMWKSCEFDSPSYASGFSAEHNNLYRESNCLVLRLTKVGNKYYAPYISTAQTLAVKRGYAECRLKYSTDDASIGGCFWFWGQSGSWPLTVEYDVYEKITDQAFIANHIHYKKNGASSSSIYDRRDFDTEWHTIGCAWNDTQIDFYFDGIKTESVQVSSIGAEGTWDYPQFFALNMKCSNNYTGGDQIMMIDYVRVWSEDEKDGLISIANENVSLAVGNEATINPTFTPATTSNMAFVMTSSNESVVKVIEYLGYEEGTYPNGYVNHFKQNRIKAVATGTATITMTSPSGITGTFNVTVS